MDRSLGECFELVFEAIQLAPRLDATAAAMAQLPDLADEQGWLAAARARLPAARVAMHRPLLDRALRLPELESVKAEHGKRLQAGVADEVERLQGAIAEAGTARSPLLEVLFHNLKVPALRKCGRVELDKFCTELQRRLATSYAARVLGSERYQRAEAAVRTLDAAIATWRGVVVDPPADEAVAAPLRAELIAAARALEQPLRQARLLAQAALVPAAELLDGDGMLTAAGRRGRKPETHPLLERDPADPDAPRSDERAELAALHGVE